MRNACDYLFFLELSYPELTIYAKALSLSEQRQGHRSIFSHSTQIVLIVLKTYAGFSKPHVVIVHCEANTSRCEAFHSASS